VATAAEHLLFLMEGRNKEFLGSTYATLRELTQRINASGYFEKNLQKFVTEITQLVLTYIKRRISNYKINLKFNFNLSSY
jgi:hypothetical protein